MFMSELTLTSLVNRVMTDGRNGSRTYELTCTDCAFTTEFEGDIDKLYEVIEAHQDRMRNSPADHFVEFEATSSSGATSAGD